MAKRVLLTLENAEYQEIQDMARSRHISIGEWVQQAVESERRRESSAQVARKLEVTRAAARHSYLAPQENNR